MCVALFVRTYINQYLYESNCDIVQFYMLYYKIKMYSILVAYRNEAFRSGWINEVKVAIYFFG